MTAFAQTALLAAALTLASLGAASAQGLVSNEGGFGFGEGTGGGFAPSGFSPVGIGITNDHSPVGIGITNDHSPVGIGITNDHSPVGIGITNDHSPIGGSGYLY